ncbi:TRAP transporter small permease [Desulfosediminicola flagellatus]|uniref:TRAP transporter small permease n=1 Tax=Desulfosediminicola flagellatus TaxID=2569541 RepID=UPI00142EBE3F|nr:TRAP transporter small permease [Desulfosediminicola flagellatus]
MTFFTYHLQKISDRLDSFFRFALFITLSAMIVLITAQIIFRVFFTALSWSEELSRYLLVWSSFIGTTVAFKKGAHIAVTFLVDLLPARMQKIVQTLSCILMAIFFGVTIWYSIFLFNVQIFQVSPAMGIKMRYIYMIIPISFSVLCVHLLNQFVHIWLPAAKKEA